MSLFRTRLVELYKSVRSPTYRDLEKCAAVEGYKLPTSTIGTLLKGLNAPRWDTVEAFITACRRSAESRRPRLDLSAEAFDLDRWRILYDETIRQDTDSTPEATDVSILSFPQPQNGELVEAVRRCVRQLIALQYPWGEWSDRRTDLESLIAERSPRTYATVPKPNVARTLFALEALDFFEREDIVEIRERALRWIISNVTGGWFTEWSEGQTPHSETRLPEMIRRADVRHTAQAVTVLSKWQTGRDPLATLIRNVSQAALPNSGFWPNNPQGRTPRLLATVYAVEALANVVHGTFRLPASDMLDRADEAAMRRSLRRGTSALIADCEEGGGLLGAITSAPNPYMTGLALFRLGRLSDRHPDLLELSQLMINGLKAAVSPHGWDDTSVPYELRARTRYRATLRCAAGLALATRAGAFVPEELLALSTGIVGSLLLSHDGLLLDSPDYACGIISLLALRPDLDTDAIWAEIDIQSTRLEADVLPIWREEFNRVVRHVKSMADINIPGYREVADVFQSRANSLREPWS